MVMSTNGMVARALVMALLAVCFSRFGGAQVPGQDRGHGDHGTPAGWRFAWPAGDPARGRDLFAKYECFSCHEVRGEPFAIPHDAGNVGPELAAMGPAHKAEYFVESIINPAVEGPANSSRRGPPSGVSCSRGLAPSSAVGAGVARLSIARDCDA